MSGLIRRGLELLSRSRVLARRLPAEWGGATVFVSPDASLRYWRRDLASTDPPLLAFARALVRPGAVVWDVGANVGLFSVAAAHCAGAEGRVLAIEADSWLCGLVRRSARGLPDSFAPIEVLNLAVAEETDLVEFSIADRGRAASHLARVTGSSQAGGAREVQTMVSASLDWLAERRPAPDLLKIDVEGAEGWVLAGGRNVLERARPTVLVEVAAENASSIGDLLTDLDYQVWDVRRGIDAAVRTRSPEWQTLAVPAEAPLCPSAFCS